jgi:hypothetical protein
MHTQWSESLNSSALYLLTDNRSLFFFPYLGSFLLVSITVRVNQHPPAHGHAG